MTFRGKVPAGRGLFWHGKVWPGSGLGWAGNFTLVWKKSMAGHGEALLGGSGLVEARWGKAGNQTIHYLARRGDFVMEVRLTAIGTRPLLLHNVQLASPLNSFSKKLKALNSKLKKTDEDRLLIAQTEWEGSFYFDDQIGPYLPGPNVFACLIEGARLTKAGRKVERGVMVTDLMCPLIYKGPRTLAKLWANGESDFVDMRTVVVQRNKIDRCRPIFRDWSIETTALLDTKVIELDEFEDVARNAGEFCGLGDYRRSYGRFSSKIEVVKD